jgi:hypothetical protein
MGKLFFALWVSASQFISKIAHQILKARGAECSKLHTGLVSFRMESCLRREEGDLILGGFRVGLSPDQLIVDVCTEFMELLMSKVREFLSWCRASLLLLDE